MAIQLNRLAVLPDDGDRLWLGGIGVDFKIRGEETGGQLAIVEHPLEPRRLVPPHMHEPEDEYSYVLEGRIGARVGDHEVEVGPGSYLLKPRGVPHAFWNPTDLPARLLEIIAPAGFERFFDELADVFQSAARDEIPTRRAELAIKYRHTYLMDWVPELKAKYGLKLLGE